MKNNTVTITTAQAAELRRVSRETGYSIKALVRLAIAAGLARLAP